jgi:hypothetical protein
LVELLVKQCSQFGEDRHEASLVADDVGGLLAVNEQLMLVE